MDSELLLKFIGYFSDFPSALSRTLLRFFGQPLSKQLYAVEKRGTALLSYPDLPRSHFHLSKSVVRSGN